MNALIIFAKYPREGNVKTRLAKSFGDEFAVKFYKAMTEHIFNICLLLPQKDFSLHIFYDDLKQTEEIKNWAGSRFVLHIQEGVNLGEKMKNAFREVFQNRYKKVIIIGTDCPELNAEILLNSFKELSQNDVVTGPSSDGGYYLLGMKKYYPYLFDEIEWSTETVLRRTISKIEQAKLNFTLLPELIDIDTNEDMRTWISKTKAKNEMTELVLKYGFK